MPSNTVTAGTGAGGVALGIAIGALVGGGPSTPDVDVPEFETLALAVMALESADAAASGACGKPNDQGECHRLSLYRNHVRMAVREMRSE
jgi:hypothetical protein